MEYTLDDQGMADEDYDAYDAFEDEALANLRDADAWSEEETDVDEDGPFIRLFLNQNI